MSEPKPKMLKAMTSGELVALIQKLDPTGEMPVAIAGGGGGEVRPIDEIELDDLWGCTEAACKKYPENAFFYLRGKYGAKMAKDMKSMEIKKKIIVID